MLFKNDHISIQKHIYMFSGINISLASLYLAEVSPKKIRGAIGAFHQLSITIGILWSMVMGLPDIAGRLIMVIFTF